MFIQIYELCSVNAPVMCRIILVVLSAAKWGRMITSLVSTMKFQLSCGDTLCLQLGQLMCM